MDPAEARSRGLAKMQEVYGFAVDPEQVDDDYVALTVDHLFGAVWAREGLDTAERRLLTVGVLAALGEYDLLGLQFARALETGELDERGVVETVVHLTHYVGWPRSTGIQRMARAALDQHADRDGRHAGDRATGARSTTP